MIKVRKRPAVGHAEPRSGLGRCHPMHGFGGTVAACGLVLWVVQVSWNDREGRNMNDDETEQVHLGQEVGRG